MSGVRFDHGSAGTPASAWTALIDALPPAEPPGHGDHVVVLAAHPDDETLGAGGLLAAAAAAGAAVTVLVATDGEASHPHSPTHRPDELSSLRRREVYSAVTALAPHAQVELLGLPDGALADYDAELAAALARALGGGVTHVLTPWADDGHPDHETCGRVGAAVCARAGVQHWQYPIWAWHWADPDDHPLPVQRLRALHLESSARTSKDAAMECHVSQHRPLSQAAGDEPVLPEQVLEHFRRDVEVFVADVPAETVSRRYFDDLYASADDPWGLRERFYERRKRAMLLAALVRPRFRRAFEPGCATGLLTAELARRCDEVVAWDIADAAVAQARARVADRPHVRVEGRAIPDEWPAGTFDLVVLSEVGYYCTDLAALTARLDASLADDGVLVACHWRHPAPLHPHTTGAVHAALGAGRHLVVSHVEDDFLLQVWTRTGQSVAAAEGIVP